ncbi:MAG: response regulator [Bradyrhizobium sp.]|nr:response regulator [Bradyrhizobium sp.]
MSEIRKKILCIEDDRETAKLIAEELSQRGFYAVIAYDGRVGLTAILKRIPDLVLCDVGLPDISGFELLASLNELVPPISRVPFVFLTGLSGRYDELQGRSLGADDYVTKPIDFDILETIIRARLFGGVARHEIPANLPKLNGHHVEARPRGPRGQACARAAVREKIVELIDAPTVDFHLDNPEPAPGTSTRTEDAAKAAMGRIIKR